jgi:hypothetical protein
MLNDWAYNETYGAKLWDPRCYRTLTSALEQLGEHPEVSFSRALGSQRKAVSRILHHETTSAEDLLVGHVRATNRRCQQEKFVLVASDTTLTNFTTHKACEGLGLIGDKKSQRGFLIHSALALTPEGVPLGVLHQNAWVRDPDTFGTAKERRERPFEQKESYKWQEAVQGIQSALSQEVRALVIQDREADIFDFFVAQRQKRMGLLIRATHPRRIESEPGNEATNVLDSVAQTPVIGITDVLVRARPDREARTASLCVQVQNVSIRAPKHGLSSQKASVALTVIRAYEELAPEGVKEPLEWVLFTTEAVPDALTALTFVDYYAKRWLIERFHYVLKSGCEFEKLQLDTFATLQKALSLYSIVAWRLLHLTYLARERPDLPAEEAISPTERHVLELATGRAITTVAEAVLAVAKIAGFRPVPSAPTPGVKSLWLGFRKLYDMVAGFQLARQPPSRLKGQD